jgi:hypothetical protein
MQDSWGGALPLRREDGQIMVGTDDLVPPQSTEHLYRRDAPSYPSF